MNKKGQVDLTIRLVGASIASAGFLVLAVRPDYGVLSSTLIGIGSIIIAVGGGK